MGYPTWRPRKKKSRASTSLPATSSTAGAAAQRLLDQVGQAVHLVEHRRDLVRGQRAVHLGQQ